MNTNPLQKKHRRAAIYIVAVVMLSGLSFWALKSVSRSAASGFPQPQVASAGTNQNSLPTQPTGAPPTAVPAVAGRIVNVKSVDRLGVPEFAWFRVHPFAAAETNGDYAWTAEDGKDTNIIRQLAHNALEYQRMVAENSTIYRRQLVYHAKGFSLLAQQAVQTGRRIQQLTLPGLDGQELPVVVTKTDFESGGDRGLFYGKLPGRPDSMVTAAFINGREAFTVVSPQDQIYLQAEARGPGEIVVKSIDPNTYGGAQD